MIFTNKNIKGVLQPTQSLEPHLKNQGTNDSSNNEPWFDKYNKTSSEFIEKNEKKISSDDMQMEKVHNTLQRKTSDDSRIEYHQKFNPFNEDSGSNDMVEMGSTRFTNKKEESFVIAHHFDEFEEKKQEKIENTLPVVKQVVEDDDTKFYKEQMQKR